MHLSNRTLSIWQWSVRSFSLVLSLRLNIPILLLKNDDHLFICMTIIFSLIDSPVINSEFLFTPVGAKYQETFVLNGTLTCGSPSPEVLATSTTITYTRIEGHEEFTRAKNYVDELIQKRNFSSKVFATSYKYRIWETVESIGI